MKYPVLLNKIDIYYSYNDTNSRKSYRKTGTKQNPVYPTPSRVIKDIENNKNYEVITFEKGTPLTVIIQWLYKYLTLDSKIYIHIHRDGPGKLNDKSYPESFISTTVLNLIRESLCKIYKTEKLA